MVCPRCGRDTCGDSGRCEACGADIGDDRSSDVTRPVTSTLAAPSHPDTAEFAATRLPGSATSGVLTHGARSTWSPGHTIAGRYHLARQLGSGGMGAVYQAWDAVLGVPVAIKAIRPELLVDAAASQGFVQRFKQELLTGRQVTHRNVLRIHDLGEVDGAYFITMPFVEGRDLHATIAMRQLAIDEILDIASQLAAGLAAAHDAGVIHRDLKPQNILIAQDGTVLISDFGLAKSLESPNVTMTRAGDIVGTPQYISPEQVEGHQADHRSDIYALGLILYEMVCGKVPFTAPSVLEMLLKRVRELPAPPQELRPDLPPFLSQIILRCLERDPAQRYQNAREVLHDLDVREGTPSIAVPLAPSAAPAMGRRTRRLLVAGAGLTALLVALGVGTWISRRAPSPAAGSAVAAPAAVVQRLAVLPFEVLGDENELGFVATGIRESLSAKLFQLKTVTLSAPSAVDAAARKGPPASIARTLGVNRVVSGSVQGADDRVRVTVHLDDRDGRRTWSKDFAIAAADLLTLQDQIFSELAAQLQVKASDDELARTLVHPTEDVDAYSLYLKGRTAMRGEQDLQNVQHAIDYYEQALKRDPRLALAYAGLADASIRMYRAQKDDKWAQRAAAAAEQAKALDDQLPEVHAAAGNTYQAMGRTSEAIAELTRATQLSPNSDDAYRRLGRAYMSAGKQAEALAAYRKATEVDPYHWVNYGNLGAALLTAGQTEEAAKAFTKVTELDPTNPNGFNDLGGAYVQLGRYDDAIRVLNRAIELKPNQFAYTNLGMAYAYMGRFHEALPNFERAAALNPNSELETGNLADGYRWAGDLQKAQTTYKRAVSLALAELRVNPRNAVEKGALAVYYAKLGDDRAAQRWIRDARAIDAADVYLVYSEALIHVLGGRIPDALTALKAAVAAGYPVSAVESDPDMKTLRDQPGWAAIRTAGASSPGRP